MITLQQVILYATRNKAESLLCIRVVVLVLTDSKLGIQPTCDHMHTSHSMC